MRVWRGVFTKESRDFVLGRSVECVSASGGEGVLANVLAKILENSSALEGKEKLTSFSKSQAIALRYAGFRGWLLELEVPADDLLDSAPFLERCRNDEIPGSEAYERLSEALETTAQDQEVFLVQGARFRIVGVHMVGGFQPRRADA